MVGDTIAPQRVRAEGVPDIVQPVWVVDDSELIRFANASAAAALGYGHASDLLGRPSHQTIQCKRPDGTAFPVQECPMLLSRTTGQEFHAEEYLVRRDGSLLPVEFWSAPIDLPDGRGAMVSFTDVSERRRTERALAERDAILSVGTNGCPQEALAARQRSPARPCR